MNDNSNLNINIILNQWSLTIQIAILTVFVIVFLALKISSPRKAIHSWFNAWLFNALALAMVISVLLGTESLNAFWLRLYYSLYALAKILFSIFLFTGLYQILNDKNLFNTNNLKILAGVLLVYFLCLHIFRIDLLSIQISVYFIVAGFFLIGSISQLIKVQSGNSRIILMAFLLEGILFFHHGFVLAPVLWGDLLPVYMTHISFYDAILELVVGISCLFSIAIKVNTELTNRNLQLSKSQKTLRRLIDVDPLTGLWHRRYFDTFLQQYNSGATVATIQIEDIETINKEWGSAVGDLCLKEVAKVMQNHFSAKDGLFRIHDDTFLVISTCDDSSDLKKQIQGLKNQVALNPLCAPIILLSTNVSLYQQKSDLIQSLN